MNRNVDELQDKTNPIFRLRAHLARTRTVFFCETAFLGSELTRARYHKNSTLRWG